MAFLPTHPSTPGLRDTLPLLALEGGLHQSKILDQGSCKILEGGPGQAPHSPPPKSAVLGWGRKQPDEAQGGEVQEADSSYPQGCAQCCRDSPLGPGSCQVMVVLGFPSGSGAPKFLQSQMLPRAFQLIGFLCPEAIPRPVTAHKIYVRLSVAFALHIWWENGVGVFVDSAEANPALSGTSAGVTPGFLL